MVRRTLAAVLWLFAAWTVGGALSVYAGFPSLLGPALGLAIAGLVWWDPMTMIWTPRPNAAARRRLADLARVTTPQHAPEVRRTSETAEG